MCDRLVERIFEIKTEYHLTNSLFSHLKDWRDYRYAYAIYITGEPPRLIDGYLADHMVPSVMTDFGDYLGQVGFTSFMDHLFALDFYKLRWHKDLEVSDLVEPANSEFRQLPVVDEILKDSRGFLLWHHQLECLFRAFHDDADKAVDLRKQINTKVPEAFDLAGSLMFGGKSLENVIRERMVLGHTVLPQCERDCDVAKFSINSRWLLPLQAFLD